MTKNNISIEEKIARRKRQLDIIAKKKAKHAAIPKPPKVPSKAQLKKVEAAKRAADIKKARHAKHARKSA